jgi:transposase
MYIRRVKKRNGTSSKQYEYLRLVENVRTENGPRQKLILNLGILDVEDALLPALAKRIENILKGQSSLASIDDKVERYAQKAASQIIQKKSSETTEAKPEFKDVDVNSFEVSDVRSIGGEHVCNRIWNELEIDEWLKELDDVGSNHIALFKTLVFSRLLSPGSECQTFTWASEESATHELAGKPNHFSKSSLYRALDLLHKHSEGLEEHLHFREKSLFDLDETIMLFDLTNTYFEGQAKGNESAKFGRSKDSRKDCPLMTLGLVINRDGFVKFSRCFAGNQSEPQTLSFILDSLFMESGAEKSKTIKPTIVMDAGIASESNLELLREKGFHYVVVSRSKLPVKHDEQKMETIKEEDSKGVCIKVKKYFHGDENFVYCTSTRKVLKEKGIRTRQEELFVDRLRYYQSGLTKKGHTKKVLRLVEMIGRLRQKYPKASKLYEVEVVPESGGHTLEKNLNAIEIKFKHIESIARAEIEGEGSYILRTDRMDLSAKEIWNLYIMLTRVENSFRSMKSHLGFRPIFHQKQDRCESHLFISVLAYRIMNIALHKLKKVGINHNWTTIRNQLSTHHRMTLSYISKSENAKPQKNHLRLNSQATLDQQKIYEALGIPVNPLPNRKLNPDPQISSAHEKSGIH